MILNVRAAMALAAVSVLAIGQAEAQTSKRYFARQWLGAAATSGASNQSGGGGTGGSGGTNEPPPEATESVDGLVCSGMTGNTEWSSGGRDLGYTQSLSNAVAMCQNYYHSDRRAMGACMVYRGKQVADYTVLAGVNAGTMRPTAEYSYSSAATCSVQKVPKASVPVALGPEPRKAVCTGLDKHGMMPVRETGTSSGVGYAETLAEATSICNKYSTASTTLCVAIRPASKTDGPYTVWISNDDLKVADPYYDVHSGACG